MRASRVRSSRSISARRESMLSLRSASSCFCLESASSRRSSCSRRESKESSFAQSLSSCLARAAVFCRNSSSSLSRAFKASSLTERTAALLLSSASCTALDSARRTLGRSHRKYMPTVSSADNPSPDTRPITKSDILFVGSGLEELIQRRFDLIRIEAPSEQESCTSCPIVCRFELR